MLLVFFAFLSGLATIISPCVLPVLPIVLSTSMGAGRLRPLGVVLGLVVSFTIFTLAGAAAAQVLALPANWLRTFAIVALGIFGLTMLIPSWGHALERLLSPLTHVGNASERRRGFGGGILMGAGLGLLWTPCVGPIMGSVIALAVSAGVTSDAAAITFAYALGAGVPLLAIGYGAHRLTLNRLKPHSETMRRAFGGLTVLACLALIFGLETNITRVMPTSWNAALTGFERQEYVQKELNKLEVPISPQQPTGNPAAGQSSTAQAGQAEAPFLPPIEPTAPPPTPVPPTEAPILPTNTPMPMPPTEVPILPTNTSMPPTVAPTARPMPSTATPRTASRPASGITLEDLGPAPELSGLAEWINSEPLTLSALRGKVVIVDFWTFGCYNCRNTRPYVRALYDKYHEQGLEILGIHTPEFAYERDLDNVRAATKEQGVTWPVALDPDFKTWRAYNNRYWPAFYFIDANGRIRHTHFGEGSYEYNEQVVRQLISEAQAAGR